jgi:hypothetical protein
MRTDDFREIGQFNEDFKNGYEDVDLCLRIVENGKRIVYQPGSKVVHYESRSPGRFESQARNLAQLLSTWSGKIRPDLRPHIEYGIRRSLEDGFFHMPAEYSATKGNFIDLAIDGDYQVNDYGTLIIEPSQQPSSISIPTASSGYRYTCLVIVCKMDEIRNVHLSIPPVTESAAPYGPVRLPGNARKGKSLFLFNLDNRFISDRFMLEFSGGNGSVELKSVRTFQYG